MQLYNDFYTIMESSRDSESLYRSRVAIDAAHPIFEGHFPGFKVTPGVVLLKIVGELTGRVARQDVMLSRIQVAKFTSVIRPEENGELIVTLEIRIGDSATYIVGAQIDTLQGMAFKGNLIFEVYPIITTAK